MSLILIAGILASLGLVALATVALAAGLSIFPFRQIKSFVLTMLWVVPALAVVGLVGNQWQLDHAAVSRGIKHASVHSALQRTVEGRAIPESGEAPLPKPAAVRPVVVTTNVADELSSTLPAEATASAAEISGSFESLTAEAADEASTLETSKTVPTLHPSPIPPLAPIPDGTPTRKRTPALTGVLKVRETKPEAPDWAGKDPLSSGESVLVPLSSERWVTLGEAEQQVTERAAEYIKQFYHDEYPLRGDWTVPVSVIEKTAVSALVGEELDKDFGGEIGMKKMYRAHLRLDVNPELRKALHASWHDQVVERRLTELGGLVALATLLLATAAGYFRLDDATNGQYRGRLKFASAALIAAGSLVAWRVVA
jgi:hypothetical protein